MQQTNPEELSKLLDGLSDFDLHNMTAQNFLGLELTTWLTARLVRDDGLDDDLWYQKYALEQEEVYM